MHLGIIPHEHRNNVRDWKEDSIDRQLRLIDLIEGDLMSESIDMKQSIRRTAIFVSHVQIDLIELGLSI